ncbi:MAG: hypothetical protein RR523_01680 [Cetobacterium sp.]
MDDALIAIATIVIITQGFKLKKVILENQNLKNYIMNLENQKKILKAERDSFESIFKISGKDTLKSTVIFEKYKNKI